MVRRTLATIASLWTPPGSNQGGGIGGPRRPRPVSARMTPHEGDMTIAGGTSLPLSLRGSVRSSAVVISTSVQPQWCSCSPAGTGSGHELSCPQADSQCSVSAGACSCPPPRHSTTMPPAPPARAWNAMIAVSRMASGRTLTETVYRPERRSATLSPDGAAEEPATLCDGISQQATRTAEPCTTFWPDSARQSATIHPLSTRVEIAEVPDWQCFASIRRVPEVVLPCLGKLTLGRLSNPIRVDKAEPSVIPQLFMNPLDQFPMLWGHGLHVAISH